MFTGLSLLIPQSSKADIRVFLFSVKSCAFRPECTKMCHICHRPPQSPALSSVSDLSLEDEGTFQVNPAGTSYSYIPCRKFSSVS
ncbi:hypothetical protein XENTR_v10015155 [Xenopus tropicalis]|nr:hypothetical protein XENTR_v10015155 [Xenopus tropicalis]